MRKLSATADQVTKSLSQAGLAQITGHCLNASATNCIAGTLPARSADIAPSSREFVTSIMQPS